MIGTVLNFASASDEGVLRSEDGQRYRFSASDWSSPGEAQPGDVVDFDPVEGRAVEIFVTKKALANRGATAAFSSVSGAIGQRVSEGRAPTSDGENPLLVTIKEKPALFAAALIALSSLLPFVSLPPLPIGNFEGGGVNLYSTVSHVWSLLGGLGMFAPSSLTVPMRLIALLLAIPIMGGYLAYREYQGTATEALRFRTGLLALIGPLGIPLISILLAMLFSGGGSHIGDMLGGIGDGGGRLASNFFGYGMLLMMMSGGALIGIGKGWNPVKLLAGTGAYFLYFVMNHG
jgi:hypothetical protein